jgi:hypothetical protein
MNVNVCVILEEVVQVNERFPLALGGLCWAISFLLGGVFMNLMWTLFSPLMGRFFNHLFHRCLILGKVDEYSHIVRIFQPMTLTILSKDTIVAMH